MQTVLTKYWLAVHVGLLWFVTWFGLVPAAGFSHRPLAWLTLLLLEALVLLPVARKGETLADARLRVGQSALRDPFAYISAAVVALALTHWLNSGRALVYLSDADVWQFSSPPVNWLPSGVEGGAAYASLATLAACCMACLALRHGMNRSGRRYLLQAMAALSGCAACWLVLRASLGSEPYVTWAREPAACNPGSFFGFWLVMGMGGCVEAVVRRQPAVWLYGLAFVGNLLGVLFFASVPATLVYVAVAALLVVYWMFVLGQMHSKSLQLRLFISTLIVGAALYVAFAFVFPGNPVAEKVRRVKAWEQGWADYSADRSVRSEAALKVWKGQPWAGVGPRGFHHFVGTVVEGKSWSLVRRDQSMVKNDALQYLCEYGALGVGLLLALVVSLAVPVCYRLRVLSLDGGQAAHESRWFLLRLSPLVVTGCLASLLVFAECWFASPFQSTAILTSWLLVQAALPAFMPLKSGST